MSDNDLEKKLQSYVENEEKSEVVNTPIKDNSSIGGHISILPDKPTSPMAPSGSSLLSSRNQIGWQQIPLKDLPTQGLFYPEGTEIVIRSASAQEIRHWSTIQEDDLSILDDMLNYVLERCVGFKIAGVNSTWKDIKEIDRFYILLAVREYTFVKGENQLQVKTSDTATLNVTKNMIDFMKFDDRLMKYYDSQERCFNLTFKSGSNIKVSIPSVGVTNFLKNYISRKQQAGQPFDMDFISYAPFVIREWRGLNDSSYEKIVIDSNGWSIAEISVLTHIKDLFIETVNPVVKYIDEGGMERTAPLNFLGGIKSLFLISNPFIELV